MPLGVYQTSGSLLHLCETAARESHTDSRQAMVAIVFAITATEALVNEILDEALRSKDGNEPQIRRLAALTMATELDGRRASLPSKLRGMSVALTDRDIDVGALPYQDFALLLQLRNALVHSRPEKFSTIPAERRLSNVVKRLVSRGVLTLEPNVIHLVKSVMCRPEVADWAYATALAVGRSVADMMPPGWHREAVLMRLPGWTPPRDRAQGAATSDHGPQAPIPSN